MGLVAAGSELVKDIVVSKEVKLIFAGVALQLEQRNLAMNAFISELIEKMRRKGIYALLVKGQGVAQCYERPLWRAAGDVDLLLSDVNYNKAKTLLYPLASNIEDEDYRGHVAMMIDSWEVELHGNLRNGLWRSLDETIEKVQQAVFF